MAKVFNMKGEVLTVREFPPAEELSKYYLQLCLHIFNMLPNTKIQSPHGEGSITTYEVASKISNHIKHLQNER